MTLYKALLAVALTVVALIVATILYVNNIDFNRHKAELIKELHLASGREIAVDGDIKLSFGLESAFLIDGLRISNPGWGSRDDMVRVGRIEARFPLGPLLLGMLRIDRLIFYDMDLWLETSGPSRANWQLTPLAQPETDSVAREDASRNGRNLLGILGVDSIDFVGARVTYRNAENGSIQVVELNSVSMRGDGFTKPMELEGEGVWNNLPLNFRGGVGSLQELVRKGGPSYKVDLTTTIGGVQVMASGNLSNPNVGSGINLLVKARADSLQGLTPILGEVAGRLKHMTLNTSVTYIRERFVMGDVRFGVSDSSMTGNLSVDFAPSVPVFDAVFNSPRIDLSALSAKAVGEPVMANAVPRTRDARSLSRDVLPWRALSAANGRVTFRGSAVQIAGVTLRGVDFDAALRNGVLTFESFRGKLGKGALTGHATIATAGNGGRVALALEAPRVPLMPLVEQMDTVRAFNGDASLRLQVSGAGDSVAGILGSISGTAEIRVGPGKLAIDMPGAGTRVLAAGPGAVFGMLVPKTANDTDIRCAAIRLALRDGVLKSVGSVAESSAAIVVADGTVDFANERINVRISPRSKGPGLWLATPVQAKGTLTAPNFGPVPGAGPATEGGELSPLAVFFDRLLNSTDDACKEAGRGGQPKGDRSLQRQGRPE